VLKIEYGLRVEAPEAVGAKLDGTRGWATMMAMISAMGR
jgi:hypothetical protein